MTPDPFDGVMPTRRGANGPGAQKMVCDTALRRAERLVRELRGHPGSVLERTEAAQRHANELGLSLHHGQFVVKDPEQSWPLTAVLDDDDGGLVGFIALTSRGPCLLATA